MTAPMLMLSQWSEPALSWGIEVAVKALVCGLLVYLVHLAVGRRRVLVRSVLWNATLVGLLILPAATACSPRWNLAIWPVRPSPRPVATDFLITTLASTDSPSAAIIATEPLPEVVQPANYGPLCVCGLYLLGLCVCLARLGRGLRSVARLRRHSTPVESACWLDRLEHWQRQLRLPIPVSLRQSDEVSVPLMMGARQPIVVIPSTLSPLDDRQTIDAILLHELAHVGRNDYSWNLLLKLVQAVYWFHPVGWCLGRILHQVREDACDSVCIHWLGGAREYVGVLVELVVSYVPRPATALGLGVTRTSRLSRRLRRLAHGVGDARYALGRRVRGMGMIGVALLVLALGSARLSPRAVADDAPGGTPHGSPFLSERAQAEEDEQKKDLKRVEDRDTNEEREVDVNSDEPIENLFDATQRDRARKLLDAAAEKTGQKVKIVKVRSGKVQDTTNLVCSLAGYEPLRVYPRLTGVVSKVEGNAGDVVKKGQILGSIDVPDAEAQIAKARAGVARAKAEVSTAQVQLEASQAAIDAAKSLIEEAQAEAERAKSSEAYHQKHYERLQNLYKSNMVDTGTVDEAEEKLNGAKADVKATAAKVSASKARLVQAEAEARVKVALVRAAEIDVAAANEALTVASMATLEEYRVVRSPADGVIAERHGDIGEAVGADKKPMFVLNSSSIIAAAVKAPESLALRIKKGMSAFVMLSASPKARAGTVTQVGYVIDPATGSFPLTIALPNPDGEMRPGMTGTALIVLRELELPVVPTSAVLRIDERGQTRFYCYKWADGHFVNVQVRLHSDDGKQAAIAEGLSVDDEVALDAQSRAEQKEAPAIQKN